MIERVGLYFTLALENTLQKQTGLGFLSASFAHRFQQVKIDNDFQINDLEGFAGRIFMKGAVKKNHLPRLQKEFSNHKNMKFFSTRNQNLANYSRTCDFAQIFL